MDKPKVFIIALALMALVLIVLIMVSQRSVETVTFPIVGQTSTQSLDGQRRYLTLFDDKGEPFVVTIPLAVDCGHASHAKVIKGKDFPTRPHYQFVSCK
ncbi:hypothetical protein [Vibrio agarivorans]|uniref:DUF2500 domain-containing protein n=1 Tax=Vibrio agarivorans TaxID=153622 RepID=A0ABT7Y5B7_9VIBR|nr:hypothetical protein [Vibrio agarivorans]MDN2483166.1 hypothetical protein [Vibrio agarivorans]